MKNNEKKTTSLSVKIIAGILAALMLGSVVIGLVSMLVG